MGKKENFLLKKMVYNHQFYLRNIKNQDILKSIDTYNYILYINKKIRLMALNIKY